MIMHELINELQTSLVLVLVLNKDHVNHQKDAHHLASVYPGYILMSGVII